MDSNYNSLFLYTQSVVAGTEIFACTFEKDTSCLLTNDHTSTTEIWDVVDGRGVVDDNTLRSGL